MHQINSKFDFLDARHPADAAVSAISTMAFQ